MKPLDEHIYDALRADQQLMELTGGRIISTCIEVAPLDKDKTPLPYIIIMDEGLQNQPSTKDENWETDEDNVNAGIEISATSTKNVKTIANMVRKVVARYMRNLDYDERPQLKAVITDGVSWDWTKPCYYTVINYQCTQPNPAYNDDDE